jgi:pimeloyl-ACP methyl ester carboxylesterase
MAGPTLLLIHGIGGTRAFWDPLLKSLRDYECVAVDVPGFGGTPAIDTAAEGPVTVARLAAALDDASLGPIVVIGHSLGGMIAQELALLAGDRVRGLVLCDTLPGVTDGAREFNPVLAAMAETEGSAAVADALLPGMFGPVPLENTEAAQERFLTDMRAADPASLAAAFRAVLTFDARDRLPELSVRALVIGGQHEGNDADQQELADLLDADCVFLPGTSHLAPVESPTAFAAEVLPLLARVRARKAEGWK